MSALFDPEPPEPALDPDPEVVPVEPEFELLPELPQAASKATPPAPAPSSSWRRGQVNAWGAAAASFGKETSSFTSGELVRDK